MAAVVEYVLSGHRYKIDIPKATCSIALSLSGVRCPGRGEPYSEEAIAFMRRKIMQRDVEVVISFYADCLWSCVPPESVLILTYLHTD